MASQHPRTSPWVIAAAAIGGVPWLSLIVVLGSLGLAGIMVYVSSKGSLTTLESSLFQAFILVLGLGGSYAFGKDIAKRQPIASAPSAFRRAMALFQALGRIKAAIADGRKELQSVAQDGTVSMLHVDGILRALAAQTEEQLQNADDALEDWRDLAPAEVAALTHRLEALRNKS